MDLSFGNIERWYRTRQPREQMMALAGAIIAPVLVFYLAIWEPLVSARAQLAKEVPLLRESAARFSSQADEVERLRGRSPGRGAAHSVRASVEETAARMGITLQGIESTGSDQTVVQVATVPFDAFSRWVGALAGSEGLVVQSVQLSAASEGTVRVDRLLLAPAGSRSGGGDR
jgi:general secretion pathway protein M